MFYSWILFPLLVIYCAFSVQNVHILNDIFRIWPKLKVLQLLRRYALIFDRNYLLKYVWNTVIVLEFTTRAVQNVVRRQINLHNIIGQTLTLSQTPLVPSLYTMYLSVLISQTDPAHQLYGVFHVITMLRQPFSLFVSLFHTPTYC